jgi:hypothetical protein
MDATVSSCGNRGTRLSKQYLAAPVACLILVFLWSAAAFGDMFVTANGRVGIGTSSPGGDLDVLHANADSTLKIQSTSSVGQTQFDQSIEFKDPGGSWWVGQRWNTNQLGFGVGVSSAKEALVLLKDSDNYPCPANQCTAVTNAVNIGINKSPSNELALDVSGWFRSTSIFASDLNNSSSYPGEPVCAAPGDGHLVKCSSSSAHMKRDIHDYGVGLDVIMKLRPVSFRWVDEFGGGEDIGLIAEEVANIDGRLTSKDLKGEVDGVRYHKLVTILARGIQEQQEHIRTLNDQVEELRKQVHGLTQGPSRG